MPLPSPSPDLVDFFDGFNFTPDQVSAMNSVTAIPGGFQFTTPNTLASANPNDPNADPSAFITDIQTAVPADLSGIITYTLYYGGTGPQGDDNPYFTATFGGLVLQEDGSGDLLVQQIPNFTDLHNGSYVGTPDTGHFEYFDQVSASGVSQIPEPSAVAVFAVVAAAAVVTKRIRRAFRG